MTRDRRAFRRAGLRIGGSDVVHAVTITDNDGTTTAVPACHQGWHPVGTRLRPETDRPVSCRRCRALSPAMLVDVEQYVPGDGSGVLPLEPLPPEPAAFPAAA